jgi:hypothetical protein
MRLENGELNFFTFANYGTLLPIHFDVTGEAYTFDY